MICHLLNLNSPNTSSSLDLWVTDANYSRSLFSKKRRSLAGIILPQENALSGCHRRDGMILAEDTVQDLIITNSILKLR